VALNAWYTLVMGRHDSADTGGRSRLARRPDWRYCWARDRGKEREMAAYVIASVDVQDPAVFEEYRRRTIASPGRSA